MFVRLFMGNDYGPTSTAGARVFDIDIEGTLEDNFDIIPEFGNLTAGMKEYLVTSDGLVNIAFSNVVENPLVNAIEVVVADSSPDLLGASPKTVDFGTTLVDNSSSQTITLSNLGFDVSDPDDRHHGGRAGRWRVHDQLRRPGHRRTGSVDAVRRDLQPDDCR